MRQSASQKPPAGDLDGFPASRVGEGVTLYRSTTPDHGPGFFSSDGGGRFDLESPDGTLYAARSVHTAVMERIAPPVDVMLSDGRVRAVDGPYLGGGIEESDARRILIWEMTADRDLAMADLTNRHAAAFGVTMELSSGGGPDMYSVAQKWAAAFRAEGLNGIEYSSRFTSSTAAADNAIAVFSAAGPGNGPFIFGLTPSTLVESAAVAGITIRRSQSSPPPPAKDSLDSSRKS